MIVRRRTGLVAGVAVSSAVLAVAYLWSFAADASWVTLAVGLLLGVVAVLHGFAWTSARTPLLVADDTGLRVRLGSAWTGVPWDQVERVQVEERGRLRDGRVTVQVADETAVLAGAAWRSRLACWCNAKLYGARLAVPYGLATSVTSPDVAGELTRLTAGRAPVVVPGAAPQEPEPTVELTAAAPSSGTADRVEVAGSSRAVAGDEVDTVELPPVRPVQPAAEAEPPARPAPPAPGVAARETVVPLPLRRVVSALRSQPARREEVTIGMRGEVTEGTLALSAPPDDAYTDELPEIAQLRRRDESDNGNGGAAAGGNIALIIDATTDLSARAMSKVRSHTPPAQQVAPPSDTEAADFADGPQERVALRIGGQLRQARETLRWSVDELADRTRIRPFVIECMEADDFAPCGGDFYARGHLRMLARVLGIDPEPLVETYDEAFATSPVSPRAVFDVELATGATGMVRGGAPGANWGGLIAAVLVLALIWGVARFFADGVSPAPAAPEPTQNSSGLGSPGVGNAPIPPPPPDAHVKLTATGGGSRVVVRDRFRDVVFEGMLPPGRSQKVAGESPLRVFAANAGVISLTVKGRSLGKLGPPGKPALRRITAEAGESTGRPGGADRGNWTPTDRHMATPRVPR